MSGTEILRLWSDQVALSIVIWLVIAILLLYLARNPAHKAIRSASVLLRNAMRVTARSVHEAERRLLARNREVLMAAGKESAERLLEREFHRVNAVLTRDLSAYPNLHRKLSDQITKIDEDYQQASVFYSHSEIKLQIIFL